MWATSCAGPKLGSSSRSPSPDVRSPSWGRFAHGSGCPMLNWPIFGRHLPTPHSTRTSRHSAGELTDPWAA